MTLIYIFWSSGGGYAGFRDVLECAQLRAECPIWVVSDGQAPPGVHHVPMAEFPSGDRIRQMYANHTVPGLAMSLARWFVLRDFMTKYEPGFPVFCSDWDVMIFRNLAEAYRPFDEYDYTISRLGDVDSAAYAVNRMEPLAAFCDTIELMSRRNDPRAEMLDDMLAWQINRDAGGWNVGNLFETHNRSVFDHNIHCGDGRFVMDGPTKKVAFTEGVPYFEALDGTPILANTIHCWGTYKTKTAELLRRAKNGR